MGGKASWTWHTILPLITSACCPELRKACWEGERGFVFSLFKKKKKTSVFCRRMCGERTRVVESERGIQCLGPPKKRSFLKRINHTSAKCRNSFYLCRERKMQIIVVIRFWLENAVFPRLRLLPRWTMVRTRRTKRKKTIVPLPRRLYFFQSVVVV